MITTAPELIAQAKSQIAEVSVAEVNQALSSDIVLIDVREPNEAVQGMIPGAVNYPRGVLEMKLNEHPQVKNSEQPLQLLAERDIFLYCRSGARSALAAESIQRMGFDRVFSMAGGILEWQKQGLSITQK